MKSIMDMVGVFIYCLLLNNLRRFVPQSVLKNKTLNKDSPHFRLYVKILVFYGMLLNNLKSRTQIFTKKLQRKRLETVLTLANKTIWWKAYLKKNNVDLKNLDPFKVLAEIPPTNRSLLLDVPKTLLSTGLVDISDIRKRKTSGTTTGTPFMWEIQDSVFLTSVYACFPWIFENNGLNFESLSKKNFYVHFNYGQNAPFTERFGTKVFLSDSRDDEKCLETMERLSQELGEFVLFTSPIELAYLTKLLKKHAIHPPIKLIVTLGWVVHTDIRHFVSDYFSCPIVPFYGTTETSLIAIECKQKPEKFHPESERVIVEILNSDSIPCRTGEVGNITITVLDNFHTPLIRYQPGDNGKFVEDVCACGVTYSPLFEIEDRASNVVVFRDGTTESAARIGRIFSRDKFFKAVKRVQVVQTTEHLLEVTVEPTEYWIDSLGDDICAAILDICEHKISVNVKLGLFSNLGTTKFKPFIPLNKPSKATVVTRD